MKTINTMKTTMKTLALALLLSINAKATVRTVSNSPAGGAQYGSLDAAYTAAVNGDTLLIEGTGFDYGLSPAWAKQLVVIGSGYNATTQNPHPTRINNGNFAAGSDGIKFFGITLYTGLGQFSYYFNHTFENCVIDGINTGNGCCSPSSSVGNNIFKNCVFTSDIYLGAGGSITNVSFISCIFNASFNGNNNTTITSLIIDHCLFLKSNQPLVNLQSTAISNCIFMNCTTVTSNCISNSFINNIVQSADVLPPTSNVGNGNLSSTDPSFVTYTNSQLYSTSHNYHLQAGSAALGAASDGSDIGPHGSITHYNETGEVLINPVMRSMIINNPTLAPNGNLNVNINATKPTDY